MRFFIRDRNVSISRRILAAIVHVITAFVLIIVLNQMLTVRTVRGMIALEYESRSELLDKTIELSGEKARLFADDYSYWDEMVSFVTTRDPLWAEINLEPAPHTFGMQATWVINANFELIYSAAAETAPRLKDFPLDPKKLKPFIERSWFQHFFVQYKGLIVEIWGAPIQHSADIDRTEKPQGFLFGGKVWDNDYLEQISFLTGSDIRLYGEGLPPADTQGGTQNSWWNFELTRTQRDPWGASVCTLVSTIDLSKQKSIYMSSSVKFAVIMVCGFILLIVAGIVIAKQVSIPLRLVSQSLAEENAEAIKPLLKRNDEFGIISSLIESSFNHKKELQNEIEKRREAEKSVREHLAEKDVLLKELHHRVKNNLQIIISLFNIQVGKVRNEYDRDLFKININRIQSMSLIHSMLYNEDSLQFIRIDQYIPELANRIVSFHEPGFPQYTLRFVLEECTLPVETATPLGIILNELITNSVKHAGKKGCTISVSLKHEEKEILIRVSDDGSGFSMDEDWEKIQTLGLSLVHILINQLGGRIEKLPAEGTAYTITIPR